MQSLSEKTFAIFIFLISPVVSKNDNCVKLDNPDIKCGYYFWTLILKCGQFQSISISNSTLVEIKECKIKYIDLSFRLSKPTTLGQKFDIAYMSSFINPKSLTIRFIDIKGFDVRVYESQKTGQFQLAFTNFYFYESKLAFYTNNTLLKSCANFPAQARTIFHEKYFGTKGLIFSNPKFSSNPICPLAFRNLKFDQIKFEKAIDTFYKSNMFRFADDLPSEITDINSTVNILDFEDCEKIKLSARVINSLVFTRVNCFIFIGEVFSIEVGTLKPMRNLRLIDFVDRFWRKLFHRGIHWTFDLNSHMRVDLNNMSTIRGVFQNKSRVFLKADPPIEQKALKVDELFPDEDFCIYAKFPFEQMVFLDKKDWLFNSSKLTCTFIWAYKYYFEFPEYFSLRFYDYWPSPRKLRRKCDFPKR